MNTKQFHKILALVLVFVLSAASLAACSSGTSDGTAANTNAGADTSQAGSTNDAEQNADAEDDTNEASSPVQVTTIKAVTGGSPKPYVYVGEDDEPTGYDVEVLKAAFELLPEYDLEVEVADFSAMFGGLLSGVYQIGVNNFSYNADRAESYLFSYPYDVVSYVFVYKNGAEPITSLADAAGKTIEQAAGVSVTNAVEAWNAQNPDQAINILYSEADMAVKLQHIEDGAADFNIIDAPMYTAYMAEYGFDLNRSVIPEDEASTIADNLNAYYLLGKDQEVLRDRLNEAIVELKNNGTLKALSEQFFGVDQSPSDDAFLETIN